MICRLYPPRNIEEFVSRDVLHHLFEVYTYLCVIGLSVYLSVCLFGYIYACIYVCLYECMHVSRHVRMYVL